MNALILKFDTDSKSFSIYSGLIVFSGKYYYTFFFFPLRLQMYHLTMANVPPVVHVPQVWNPCSRLYRN